jgi:hypothetical protein
MIHLARNAAALAAATLFSTSAIAAPAGHPKAEAQALDLSMKSIAIRSVRGEGNRTIDVANLYRDALLAAGWKAADIEIVPVDDTA